MIIIFIFAILGIFLSRLMMGSWDDVRGFIGLPILIILFTSILGYVATLLIFNDKPFSTVYKTETYNLVKVDSLDYCKTKLDLEDPNLRLTTYFKYKEADKGYKLDSMTYKNFLKFKYLKDTLKEVPYIKIEVFKSSSSLLNYLSLHSPNTVYNTKRTLYFPKNFNYSKEVIIIQNKNDE